MVSADLFLLDLSRVDHEEPGSLVTWGALWASCPQQQTNAGLDIQLHKFSMPTKLIEAIRPSTM
jgi:hypothetical protein